MWKLLIFIDGIGAPQKWLKSGKLHQNSHFLISPGTANISFNIELSSNADPKVTLVSNIGRAIIKETGSQV